MEPMIQVENLCKSFSTKNGTVEAARNISFSIEKGEIFGIIGLSGAGKSTLVRCLNLLERPTSGTVRVNGKNLTKLSEKELRKERQNIGMIFQHFNLLMQRTALDNVCFPMEIAGISKKEARKKALIHHSFPVVRNSVLQLHEFWQVIRKSCSVTRRPVHWIHRQQKQFWN